MQAVTLNQDSEEGDYMVSQSHNQSHDQSHDCLMVFLVVVW